MSIISICSCVTSQVQQHSLTHSLLSQLITDALWLAWHLICQFCTHCTFVTDWPREYSIMDWVCLTKALSSHAHRPSLNVNWRSATEWYVCLVFTELFNLYQVKLTRQRDNKFHHCGYCTVFVTYPHYLAKTLYTIPMLKGN